MDLVTIKADKLNSEGLHFIVNPGGAGEESNLPALTEQLNADLPPFVPPAVLPGGGEAGYTHYIEDLKPFAKKWLKLAWKTYGGAVTGVLSGGVTAFFALPAYVYYILAFVAVTVVLATIGTVIVTVVLGGLLAFNRLEIGKQISDYNKTKADPSKLDYDIAFTNVLDKNP